METTLINHLTEKYGEICDSEFFFKSVREKNAKVIRLIMKKCLAVELIVVVVVLK